MELIKNLYPFQLSIPRPLTPSPHISFVYHSNHEYSGIVLQLNYNSIAVWKPCLFINKDMFKNEADWKNIFRHQKCPTFVFCYKATVCNYSINTSTLKKKKVISFLQHCGFGSSLLANHLQFPKVTRVLLMDLQF